MRSENVVTRPATQSPVKVQLRWGTVDLKWIKILFMSILCPLDPSRNSATWMHKAKLFLHMYPKFKYLCKPLKFWYKFKRTGIPRFHFRFIQMLIPSVSLLFHNPKCCCPTLTQFFLTTIVWYTMPPDSPFVEWAWARPALSLAYLIPPRALFTCRLGTWCTLGTHAQGKEKT